VYQFFFLLTVRALLLFLLVCGSLKTEAQNLKKIDSLKSALKDANAQDRYLIEFNLFTEYYYSNYDEAILHVSKALSQALLNGDSVAIVNSANAKGYHLKQHGDTWEAIKLLEPTLKIARRNNYKRMVMILLNNLALSYTTRADYDKALEYNFESLKIREIEGDPESISVALNNIGLVYHELKDFENALVYYDKSYQVKIANGVTSNLDANLINLGLILNALGRFDAAEQKLKEVFTLCDSSECVPDILVEANQALAIALLNDGITDQSEVHFIKSLDLSRENNLPEFTASNFYWLARLRYSQKRFDEAIDFLRKSQDVASESFYRKQILENYLYFSRIYSDLGEFKKASDYKDSYIKLYSEIFNADLIKNISRIQTAYQEQENIKTIAEKDEVLELNQEVIVQQRTLNWLLIAVIALTSVLGIVVYRNYKKIKAVNSALASAKRIIEVQNRLLDKQVQDKTKELVDTNESLMKVNDELDNFIYKTSHDIRGPLASLKGMVNLAIMDVKDEKALGYLGKLDLTAEKLNMVLTRLLIVNRINHAELKPEVIHFEPIIQEILTLEMKKGVPAKIKIEYDVAPDIELTSDREMIRLILENLIDNALKFYSESQRVDSFVKIVVRSEDGKVTAHVTDNGVGISQMNRERIFQMFVRASERSETGGIGLYLAKLATEKLGGDINLVSTDAKYTEFIVRFPKNLMSIIEKRKEERHKLEQERVQVGSRRMKTPSDFQVE
ncbi:MAG: tetratricopeptide repeat-containing sensor histidine kinase, partial [Bacteroidota bacterium]